METKLRDLGSMNEGISKEEIKPKLSSNFWRLTSCRKGWEVGWDLRPLYSHHGALQIRVRTFFMTTSPIYFGYFLPGSNMYLEWLTVFAKLNGNHFPASLSVDTYISLTTFKITLFLADFWRLQRPYLPAESAQTFTVLQSNSRISKPYNTVYFLHNCTV